MSEQNNEFKNRCYGLVIIKSENSNFNADFTGNPRRLPDENGTIYATDKALKYAIRRYWKKLLKKDVFVWKSLKEDETPLSLRERYEEMSKKLNAKRPIDVFSECIDTRLFGITYAVKGESNKENLSITGPVQISYGVNKFSENISYTNDILSPYRDEKKKEAKQSTIGNESKSREVYYVYDFSVNPQNLSDHKEEWKNNSLFIHNDNGDENDIIALKDALKYAVTSMDTTSKKDSENVMLLFITLPEKSEKFLPSMKNLVKIQKCGNKVEIDLTEVKDLLTEKDLASVELYYNKHIVSVLPKESVIKEKKWTVDDNM